MNEHFINIKVDREERPDIDQVYMNAVQLMTGRGGWPLNCFTLPDGRPVYGGTYFPKESWKNILLNLADVYKNDFIPKDVTVCPAKVHLETKARGRFTGTKGSFTENTDFKAIHYFNFFIFYFI